MRPRLSKLGLWRRLHAPLPAGWLAGRFPHALRAGTFRQQRDYFLYVPTTVTRRERVPLLLMLHGCGQDARTFAEGTRMNELADQHGFIVLYPQQSLRANPLRCWNWFESRTRDGAVRRPRSRRWCGTSLAATPSIARGCTWPESRPAAR